jgi:tRNA(Ile)-lysidine synthase TilS/MesJ
LPQPEFFFDRSLGKLVATQLRYRGWIIHRITDHFPEDAQKIPDEQWIDEGIAQGWSLLTKDRRIRYRNLERSALTHGVMFLLSHGNLTIAQMVQRFENSRQKIWRATERAGPEIWVVYENDVIQRWPSD